jgi:hypothetical protein
VTFRHSRVSDRRPGGGYTHAAMSRSPRLVIPFFVLLVGGAVLLGEGILVLSNRTAYQSASSCGQGAATTSSCITDAPGHLTAVSVGFRGGQEYDDVTMRSDSGGQYSFELIPGGASHGVQPGARGSARIYRGTVIALTVGTVTFQAFNDYSRDPIFQMAGGAGMVVVAGLALFAVVYSARRRPTT